MRLVIYTSLTLLALQCFMQIPFAYIPTHGKKQQTCDQPSDGSKDIFVHLMGKRTKKMNK